MKTPSQVDQIYCIEIRKRSKRGERLSRDECDFIDKMYKQFPEWYISTNQQVFNETAPFGSVQQMESLNNGNEEE